MQIASAWRGILHLDLRGNFRVVVWFFLPLPLSSQILKRGSTSLLKQSLSHCGCLKESSIITPATATGMQIIKCKSLCTSLCWRRHFNNIKIYNCNYKTRLTNPKDPSLFKYLKLGRLYLISVL